jgi:rRNA pseudouridine-1189 N-methylase Emg1 (Nep1/Mra1 family)
MENRNLPAAKAEGKGDYERIRAICEEIFTNTRVRTRDGQFGRLSKEYIRELIPEERDLFSGRWPQGNKLQCFFWIAAGGAAVSVMMACFLIAVRIVVLSIQGK